MNSKLLMHERPLTVLPSLVAALGFEKAVVLQQIFWLQNQPNSGRQLDDGEKWVWGTYEEWCERYFPFWQPYTLRKHVTGLEKLGLLLSCQPKTSDWDRTKHYRVDVGALERFIEASDSHPSMRSDEHASKGADEHASRRSDEHASNYTDEHASYKETDPTTDLTTEPTSPTRETRSSQPPKAAAATEEELRNKNYKLLKSKLGRRRDTGEDLLMESIDEDHRRDAWLTLPDGRIKELIVEANPSAKDGNFKTTLMGLLDREMRKKLFTHKAASPPVAAAPPQRPEWDEEAWARKREQERAGLDERERYYFDLYGPANWRAVKERDDYIDARKAREEAQRLEGTQGRAANTN